MFMSFDGPVICMPPILSSSIPHYGGSPRVSPRAPTPPLSIRDQLIERLNLLRDMHLALFQEIAERNYRAERELNISHQERKVTPPSPSKDQIQNPLRQFYQDKVQKLPELPAALEMKHMSMFAKLTQELDEKIAQTEREFTSKANLREQGMEARIINDSNGDEKTLIRADLAQFHREIPDKFTALRERVTDIRIVVGPLFLS